MLAVEAARAATTAVFFATGAVFGTWAARIPAVQERLGLSAGELAVAVLGSEAGAIAGLPLGGVLAARLGSRSSLRLGFAVFPPSLVGVATAPGLGWLAAALAAGALANSVVDVAMNAQGVELERRLGRPVMSGLHAGHGFGVLAGGLVGTAAAAGGVPVLAHFAGVAAAGLITGQLAMRRLVDEARGATRRVLVRPSRDLLALGAVAFCAFFVDGAAGSWSAVHLRTERDAGGAVAAAGFTAFALALALGRLAGDRLVALFGRARVVGVGGCVAAAGAITALTTQSPAGALVGWAVVGAGLANAAPVVLGAAAAVGPAAPAAIAAVTTLGYLGSFTGPPLIGALAEVGGLTLGLGILVPAAVAIALMAGCALNPRRAPRPCCA